jgi:hypothetical protein
MLAIQMGSYMCLDDACATFFANNDAAPEIIAKVRIETVYLCNVTITPNLLHRQLETAC